MATPSSRPARAVDRPLPIAPGADLARRALAEGIATAFLLCIVVGSGIMGERLAGGNPAVALLANSLATGAGLVALIFAFGPVSGAHLNPAITLAQVWARALPAREASVYVGAQTLGALAGVAITHRMFGEPLFTLSPHSRAGFSQVFAEAVATFGLVLVIRGASRVGISAVAFAVGTYIAAAYWFTSSTSFSNPAASIARALTDSFTGIRPADVPGFVVGELLGAALGARIAALLFP